MKHTFNSSNLQSAAFGNGTIAVTFKNGKTYHYPHCTQREFEDLKSAESAGNYFFKHFRHKHFRTEPNS